MNPAGILFGPHARLDVPGSFHASTADELRFADGKVFSALDLDGNVLSVAAPEAFGFLRAKPSGISVDQSVLEVNEGKALSLVGGDIDVTGGRLKARAGTVALAATRTAGEVGTGDDVAPGGAEIRLTDGAVLETSGNGGGTVRIRGEHIVLTDASSVTADNTGAADAKSGVVLAADVLEMKEGSNVRANTLGKGTGGRVMVNAGTLELLHGSGITSGTFGAGDAGEIAVTAGRLLVDGSNINSTAYGFSAGNGGSVTVKADMIKLRGQISSVTAGLGDAGPVVVQADTIETFGCYPCRITSISRAKGDPGPVTVRARSIELHDYGEISSLAEGDGGTDAGSVVVQADMLKIHDGGKITTTASLTGNAGAVLVEADILELRDNGSITSDTWGPGDAGTVVVKADTLEIHNGGGITSNTYYSKKGATGNTGQVVVTADRLLIEGDEFGTFTGITSTTDQLTIGNAGTVTVKADTLEIRDGGSVSTTTFGVGNAGEVAVTATSHLLVDGADPRFFTGIRSSAGSVSTGMAGRVVVTADTVELRGVGMIDSSTFGLGSAGEVVVTADRMTVADQGTVETNSTGRGAAGNVSILASRLKVRDGGEISSSGTGSGRAGDVRVGADTLEVENASIRTEGAGAAGGRIDVVASDLISLKDAEVTSSGIEPAADRSVITLEAPLIALNASRVTSLTGSGEPLAGSGLAQLLGEMTVISADSFVAASSTVTLTGVEGDVGSQLVVPESVFLNVGDLLRESCAARRTGAASSFTAMGRGGLPPDPAGPLAGSYREPGGTTVAGQPGPVLAASFGEGCRAAPGG
jgi:large exoprotein involved in heme utilization and adhesion